MTPGSSGEETARLDGELVRRGLARSRSHARRLVRDGSVRVDGKQAVKSGAAVRGDARLQVVAADPAWVGRGAYKLLAALERFAAGGLVVQGRRCLDVGASTGGFTEVLLAAGAAQVVALDVGHGQLAGSLASDVRVEERSGVNIRGVLPGHLGDLFDMVVVDLSFISLRLVLDVLARLVTPDGDLVLLVKPQFEVGRQGLTKRGVVRSARDRLDGLTRVCRAAAEAGLGVVDLVPCPLLGAAGNQEYLLWVTPRAAGRLAASDLERRIAGMEQP